MVMEKEFTPYNTALRMKAIGFDETCFGHFQQEFHDDGMTELEPSLQMIISKQHQHAYQLCTAPLYQQAFRWFRAKYSICVEIHETTDWEEDNESWSFVICKYRLGDNDGMISSTVDYDTYEEAELDCLKKLIEIVEKELIN
jgi:hypothetical protein